jgi:hypothetical protein
MNHENFENFEKVILNNEKTPSIKYRIDENMEAAVKYQFLCDSYGKDRVQSVLTDLNLSFLDLANQDSFKKISEKISVKNG